MMSAAHHKRIRIRHALLVFTLAIAAISIAACTSYRDPRAEVVVTSNRENAEIYLVPMSLKVPKPPTRATMQEFAVGSTSSKRGLWVDHGTYWLVLEKDGTWSQPVEFEIRLDYLNKVHVEF